MKKKQYEGQSYHISFWLAKLGEEFGEVARAVVDDRKERTRGFGALIEELEHVEFIARCFREDLERRV